MNAQQAQNQIKQMTTFIYSEARDKAAEISKKGEEEFSIEVHRLITEQKDKVRQQYEKKTKAVETKYAIEKSMAINKKRLEKIKARQEMMGNISNDVRSQIEREGQNASFVTKLIVQGLLMLLETEVIVRCRKSDESMVRGLLSNASAEYAKYIKQETGKDKSVRLTVDTEYLPQACLGGVMLLCSGKKITIDNTISVRLNLVMEQAKPAIRSLLFPDK